GRLAEELTVGETYFFRNGDQFRALEHVLRARIRTPSATRRLSVLSAGCSSGEEPFTIAMLTRDNIPSPPWHVVIRAVDLNPGALRKAESGRFGKWALRETPAPMLQRWFTVHGKEMLISKELRDAVQFDLRNLTDPNSDIWQPGAYDVVFCRNVIMYLTPEAQRAVAGRIANALMPGGYLFLGHAETLRGLSQEFHLVHTHGTFYYQRKGTDGYAGAPEEADTEARLSWPAWSPSVTEAVDPDTSWYDAIDKSSRHIETLARPAPMEPAAPPPPLNLKNVLDLLQRERFAEALDVIGRMPSEAAQDTDVLLLQALLLVQGGQPASAAEVCKVLLAGDEFNAGANYVLALCFEGAGDAPSATLYYGIASQLDPGFAMPLLRRGLLARRSGDLANAANDLRRAQQLLQDEDASRLLLFGGGFTRLALARLCASELATCTGTS
ncbi:MAG TPA: protein-glutamate O-methyltransferase CheR, partial [Devosia sp.]|nr:protein-glutamate O-methyltransferase CheR [Devosia sp.]